MFLTILFSAIAPALSQTLAGDSAGRWIEVCSVGGGKLVQVDADGNTTAPLPANSAEHKQHCLFCFSHSADVYLPAVYHLLMLLLPETARAWPAAQDQAPLPQHNWPASLARAPPLLF